MSVALDIPITKPTPTEIAIWSSITPIKIGGLLRQGSADRPYDLPDCYYGPRDKTKPQYWDCKMQGGPDAEWWVYMMEGAKRVLDVGCGFGFPSFYLASHGFEVVGVDPSPSEIATAEHYRQEMGPDLPLEYRVIEQAKLPFPDNSFDGATFSGSIACTSFPEALASEVVRVLQPGSRAAFDEEDRALEPCTHPVAEQMMIVQLDNDYYLWVESRICKPYLTRRYMIRLSGEFQPGTPLCRQKAAGAFLPGATPEEAGVSFEEALSFAAEGEYGEALGYDAYTLRDFIEKMGFTDLKFWARNNGQLFAQELAAAGVLDQMPDDLTAVLRALVRSIPLLATPTTLVSCRSPHSERP